MVPRDKYKDVVDKIVCAPHHTLCNDCNKKQTHKHIHFYIARTLLRFSIHNFYCASTAACALNPSSWASTES